MKERKEQRGILSDAIRLAWREQCIEFRPDRCVPVCVFNGSRNRGETEEGSNRQGLNVLQYYNSAGYD